ncbi:hypothetical protein PDN58_18215 [Bacillus cereus]|uniref:hypothetical protein n=1 Tax=Bacillus cereus group TaxID=86661 RepID=UPI0009196B42|nr:MULTISPECIES: hypothetical protein [Bacillus cereus group]UBR28594.1 hypothetical protein LCG60_18370 [Bacillus sp. SD-4]AXO96164.1 hypothetical protein DY471_25855 [Bacillus anthracis]MDA2039344.1 hypothetical protein [Bacillus cereus]MDA2056141.1 hypothetical protein [Bacillus cereus]OJD98377.1 hypothetical protein MCCC1A01412_04605 [Bacillus anthracis]
MKQPTVLAAGAGYYFKAEVACSECEGDGAFDVEALFASNEGVKQPTVLAAGAGYYFKSGSGSFRVAFFYEMIARSGT